jgi:hypothetical protein
LRPQRADIAVPPLPSGVAWIGEEPRPIERLTARGPALVHFVDVGHLSSVRTLPYLAAWHERYSRHGLTVLGVNSPRFAFTGDRSKLAAAARRLELPFPLAADPGFELWRAYAPPGWPSLFLWGRGGVLRWYHFGEGEYQATEAEIRAELAAGGDESGLPEPLAPLRASDAPGARVVPPTPEVFPGGDPATPLRAARGDGGLELPYEGAGAAATVDGEGVLEVGVDDEPTRRLEVSAPGVYELADHDRHGSHTLRLRPSGGLELWCVAFAPGCETVR